MDLYDSIATWYEIGAVSVSLTFARALNSAFMKKDRYR